MSGWQTVRLGDLCSHVTSGGTPLRSIREYYDGGTIPWMKTGEVKKGYVWEVEEHITERGLRESSAKLIPANSLIVAMYGDGNTAGNVAVNKVPLTTNQACCNFTLNPVVADYRYVYHYLKGSYSNLVGLKLGGSQQNLNAATLKAFPVNLPTLATQQKIAAILCTYDDLIANNQRRITLLERMAEDIYREWFVRLRFPGHENAKVEKGVPQGWRVAALGEIFKTASGGTPSRAEPTNFDGEIAWIKTGELKTMFAIGSEERITQRGIDSSAAKVYKKHTVVMAMYCAMPDLSVIANDAATNQACCAFIPRNKNFHHSFSYFLIKFAQLQLVSFAHGAAQQNLSQEIIKKFPVWLPSENLISAFGATMSPIFDSIEVLMRSNLQIKATRDSLLPRLISGKLSVDALDIRFPPGMGEPGL